MPASRKEFASRFAIYLKHLNLSQRELCKRLGKLLGKDLYHLGTVSNWHTGKLSPKRDTIFVLSHLTTRPEEVFNWLVYGGAEPWIALKEPKAKKTGDGVDLLQEFGSPSLDPDGKPL